jgi:Xaa-Pro aminopeptidase
VVGVQPITRREHAQRVEAVRERARAAQLDAVVAYGAHRDYQPADLRYLADWYCVEEETAFLFVPVDGPTQLVTDASWDLERAEAEAVADGMSHAKPLGPALVELIRKHCGLKARIGIAGWRIFPAPAYLQVMEALPDVQVSDASQLISDLRMIKSSAELAIMREAATVSDAAMAAGLEQMVEGSTEYEVAAAAEHVIRASGAEPSFVTEMGAGPRTALGTFLPSHHRLAKGEVAVLDCGARVHGYHGDMCRTLVVGGPDASQRALLEAVAHAVRSAIDRVRPGVTVGAVRDAAAAAISDAGFGDYWWDAFMPHGNGTGQHEPPNAKDEPELALKQGMVLCIEPGIAVPEQGAFILEQMIAVGAEGAELLTALPLEMWQ